ncbi:hypothetical protein [Nocardioides sp. cx-173]|uniref:hypothetical protein n=1 Tax=Nocardioides sp. cx-173 TaxID=2898796 RepID=UPI001E3CF0C3|nr:hypothetical protein [Nocardioides sp. cx-173]MCD4527105.1 hypothetical protein [Nocardioides sp. cx-173]UGB42468.1 hypothetical protein LQ940_02840 [Nocardioides sp. cx-173]
MSQGKRAGSRRGSKPKRGLRPALLGYALAVTISVLAWGYLVYAAIDFGGQARGGDGQAWTFLGLASLGAVACLFLGLILAARLLRALGITQPPPPQAPSTPVESGPPASPGGRRAAR